MIISVGVTATADELTLSADALNYLIFVGNKWLILHLHQTVCKIFRYLLINRNLHCSVSKRS
jgi:hypothetical protein